MKAKPATPLYRVGTPVRYVDHHARMQLGKIQRIEAHWHSDGIPFINYTVEHPTYRGYRMYIGENDIMEAFPK